MAGAVVVALAAVWLVRSRSASGRGFDTSGNPRAGRGESGAQEPSGGAAGIPDNMPTLLLSHPDELQQQVQSTDASSSDVPTSDPNGYSYIGPAETVNGSPVTQTALIGGVGYEQSAPGSDYFQVVPISEAAPPGSTNIHKPGLQM